MLAGQIIKDKGHSKQSLRRQGGFTLVEAVVVIVLMTLVVAVGYMIFLSGLKSYSTTYDKTSAQENFRLTIDHIDREVGVAEIVTPMDVDPANLPALAADEALIYRKPLGDGEAALFLKTDADEVMIGYPGRDLSVSFQSESGGQILKIAYSVKGMDTSVSSVYLENTLIDSTIFESKNGVMFTMYPTY